MTAPDVVVAGGGFAGLYAAWRLARAGAAVALVEASGGVGGVLRSRPWAGHRLDNGTHFLDLGNGGVRAFYEDVLGEALVPLEDPRWASTLGATWTPGFERQDYAADAPATAARALVELAGLEAAARAAPGAGPGPDGYLDWYRDVHGPTLAGAVGPMVRKVTGSAPEALAAEARVPLDAFSRPKLGDDASMAALKARAPFWDARVGVTLGCAEARFAGADPRGRFGRPPEGGLLELCERAAARLAALGVELVLGGPIDRVRGTDADVTIEAGGRTLGAGRLLWTLPDFPLAALLGIEDRTRARSVPVGTALFAFEVPERAVADLDYLVDYDVRRPPLRYASPATYGRRARGDGHVPVLAEVPCHPADLAATLSEASREAVWEALLDSGFVRRDARARRSTAWGVPVAYALPRPGWRDAHEALRAEVRERLPRALCAAPGARGRNAFAAHYDAALHARLVADVRPPDESTRGSTDPSPDPSPRTGTDR